MFKILLLLFSLTAVLEGGIPITWKRVYLASYPRSGNHWMRYLIEEATGVLTGSVFCDPDPPHSRTPYPWGGYAPPGGYEGNRRDPTPKDLVVIKSHLPMAWEAFDLRKRVGVIRIVRHPVDTFYSLYVYSHKGKPHAPDYPNSDRLQRNIKLWREFQEYWNKEKDVVTIRYEDLYTDPFNTLKNALKQAGFKLSDADIRRAVEHYPPEGALLKHIHHFTKEQLDTIKNELHDLMEQFGYML